MSFLLQHISTRHIGAAKNAYALQDVTLSIKQGEQVALIGPSGAGKTSLLHTLAGALQPAGGSVRMFDIGPWTAAVGVRHAVRARLFLAPQTPPLPPRQRVVNAVLAGMLPRWSLWQALASLIKPRDPAAAYAALARFDLQDKLYARVDRLSGGERQRCGLARALVSNAEAFLIDEPLSALDPTLAVQTLNVLLHETRQRRATLVCSLHQVELARAHFPRIVGLRDGRIVFDAAGSEVSDAMIAALYQNRQDELLVPAASDVPVDHLDAGPIPRC
jgi:phosphonate transport system ATP-binding protein